MVTLAETTSCRQWRSWTADIQSAQRRGISAYSAASVVNSFCDRFVSLCRRDENRLLFVDRWSSLVDQNADNNWHASDTGTQNLKPLHLFVPSDLPTGTTVTLTDSQPGEVDVWNSANPGSGASPLLGTGTGSVTWTVGSQSVPSTLYVGIEHGSANVGDIQCTLAVTPPGGQAVTAKTAPATAVVLKITLGDAGQKQVNILTSSGGLNALDLVPLDYIYEGPTQASLTISKAAAQEIEVWTTETPTAGDKPALGGSSGLTILPLKGTDIVNGQLWVGASAIPKIGTISDNIQFTLKPILPAPLAPVTVQSQKATAIPGQIDIFFDGTGNNGPANIKNGTDTNVYKISQAVTQNLAYDIYEKGVGTGGIAGGDWALLTGDTCTTIENDAWNQMGQDLYTEYKHLEEGTVAINIVGFSRGAVEALDFANRVESNIQTGSDFSFPWVSPTNNIVATGVHVNFLGLYDPVDSINASRDNPGGLNLSVPAGVAHVADAVALSENRYLFDDVKQPILDPTAKVVGFMGAHADIGGGYVNDPISDETLSWMAGQATAAGMVFTTTFPTTAFTAADIHDSWMGSSGEYGGRFPFPTEPIERTLPAGLTVYTSGGYVPYGSQLAGFWDPDFQVDANSFSGYWKSLADGGW